MDAEPTSTLLAEPDPADADSLISTNDPDENAMQNEQTWPSEEEMQGDVRMTEDGDDNIPDAKSGTTPKSITKKRTVPKGTSAYQAAWIVDEDEEDGEGDEDDEASDIAMDGNAEEDASGDEKEVIDEEEEEHGDKNGQTNKCAKSFLT